MPFNLKEINQEEFKNPPKHARPMVRWWWTGLDVEKEELVTEVRELDEVGFLGAEIQVFMIGSPMDLETKDKERAVRAHRFMQPYYYEMIKAVLDEASKRGMIMDLTIGSSWPAGGVHISIQDSMKVLLVGQKTINGPLAYSDKIPNYIRPPKQGLAYIEDLKEGFKLEAVIAFKPIGKPGQIKFKKIKTTYIDQESIIDLTENVDDDYILSWNFPEGVWQILSFYSGPSGVHPLADSRSELDKGSLVLDHLSSKSIKKHLDLHLGEGKKYFKNHFGTTLRAFFTDSLELSSSWLWTEDLLEQFNKRRGYSLKPFLPVCFVPNRDNKYLQAFFGGDTPLFDFKDDIGEKIRYDYEKTISDLFSEEFVKTMTIWAEKNELKNRIQAYGIRVDNLKTYGIAHIPETEQLYAGGIIDFLKFAGSAAILYEKPIVTAESIVWNQRDYMTTPLKWKVAADRLFISGVNQMIYHGFPYQNIKFPYPGFCGFSTPYLPQIANFSSNFGRMNPFWEFFPIMNKYVSRCQYILQHGKTVSNIAIYYSIFNYCDTVFNYSDSEELVGGYLDQYDAPLTKGGLVSRMKKKLDTNEKWASKLLNLTDKLSNNGFFYTHINEESILNSRIINNKLIIGMGEFEVLIFPNIEKISLNMARKLKEISNSGISIIFISTLPDKQLGFLNFEQNDKVIKSIINELIENKKASLIDESQDISQYLIQKLNINPGIRYKKEQPSINYIHKRTESADYCFLRHSLNQPKKLNIRFPFSDKVPFILDPWSGKISQAAQYKKEHNSIEMDLSFNAYGSIILEFKKTEEKLHITESKLKTERINGGLVCYGDTPGKFLLRLSNGDEKVIIINEEDLVSIPLNKWHLNTNIRDHLGNISPIEMDLEELEDWRNIPELKYCSSKGVYTTKFNIEEKYIQNDLKFILSLGRVHDVAVVKINGSLTDPLLVYPYEIDIAPYIKSGENDIKVEITPTLRNRLNGYGEKGGENWINHKNRKEFMPSGLVGPVVINTIKLISF